MTILGVVTLLRALTTTFSTLLGTAFLIGCTIAILGPLVSGFIKSEFPEKTGLLIGVYSLSMGLGAVSASSSMLYLTDLLGGRWNLALASWGIIGIITAIIWSLTTSKMPHKTILTKPISLKMAYREVWPLLLIFGLQSGIFYSLTTWLADYFLNQHISAVVSVTLLTFFTAVQMIASFLIPALMDRFGNTQTWLLGCCMAMIVGSGVIIVSHGMDILVIASLILMAFAAGGLFPIAMLLPLQKSHDAHQASIYTSAVQSGGYLIGGLIPILVGIVIDFSNDFNTLFWVIIFATILIIGLSKWLRKEA